MLYRCKQQETLVFGSALLPRKQKRKENTTELKKQVHRYVTTCRGADVGVAVHPLTDFQVQPLTVAYWTKQLPGTGS